MRQRRRWLWSIGGILLLAGLWNAGAHFFPEGEKTLRRRFREAVIVRLPERAQRYFQSIGLVYHGMDRRIRKGTAPRSAVVLVHGLDDPGKVWQSLSPELEKAGFHVWLLNYPNDQPIAASARLFFEELAELRQFGVARISIVAHSMGGLVAREMLTSPGFDYIRAAKSGQVPEVATLTMVGTPNHGSQLVRFRVFAEVRDQLARMVDGEGDWLGGVLDGAGEAKVDLLPGSLFLTALNARPHPAGVDQLVIAGTVSPWNEGDIRGWMDKMQRRVAADRRKQVEALGAYMMAMTNGLGDGLVTVTSTRLEGVPHRTVDGSHLSMIRNVTRSSRRMPPAVPIIVRRLEQVEAIRSDVLPYINLNPPPLVEDPVRFDLP
jgi:pimeloyl-ACP methyl ester carboxylesterase